MGVSGQRSRWLPAVVVLTVLTAAPGIYFRFTDLMDALCRSPDEMSEIMPGLRLHALPLLTATGGPRYNFLQSMFFSQHGLGDTSFYYLASGTARVLDLPVSEHTLFVAGGVTNVALAIAGIVFGSVVLESAATGWTFAALVFASPFFVFVSRSGWARLTWTPLLVVLLFLAQARAMRTRRAPWIAAFVALAAWVSLTDGFVALPLLVVLGLLAIDGSLRERLRRLARDRVFLAGVVVFAAGVAFDIAIGLVARSRGTNLTMVGYVLLRGARGGWIPSSDVWRALARAIDWYFPFRGAWMAVTFAFALAVAEGMRGIRGRAAGFLAAWWLVASYGVVRYVTGLVAIGHVPEATWLNASPLATPSYLLVAWAIAAIAEGRVAIVRRAPAVARGGFALALLLALVTMMARQAEVVAFERYASRGLLPEHLTHETGSDLSMSVCRATKAAAFYVRSHAGATLPYVFHLSTLTALGHFGEFYYGLSYSGSDRPPDPNHLLDFGKDQFGRAVPPESFYRAYGVAHFDYYVEFVDEPRNAATPPAVDRLIQEGAGLVCTIRDGGRAIGRIYAFGAFDGDAPIDITYQEAEAGWDRTVGRSATRQLQPLVGTAYHFGYSWRPPE